MTLLECHGLRTANFEFWSLLTPGSCHTVNVAFASVPLGGYVFGTPLTNG